MPANNGLGIADQFSDVCNRYALLQQNPDERMPKSMRCWLLLERSGQVENGPQPLVAPDVAELLRIERHPAAEDQGSIRFFACPEPVHEA